jgi:hypothetical protein
LVATHSIEPSLVAIRTLTDNGERGTISGLLEKGKGFPQADIDRIIISLKNKGKDVRVTGIVDFQATVLGKNYSTLTADNDVFLADALESYFQEEAKKLKSNAKSVKYRGPEPYWSMETLGMIKY